MADNRKPNKHGSPSDRDQAVWPLPPGIEAPLSIMQQGLSPSYFAALEATPPSFDDNDWKDSPGFPRVLFLDFDPKPTKKMILFLDFDGVLHPDAAFLINGRPTLKAEGQLFMWAPLLIKVLDDFPDVRIVLSTSWARELSYTRACLWLPVELRQRVIGATWHSGMSFKRDGFHSLSTWYDEASRYQQIKRYAGRAGLTDWVAVDDQPEGWNEVDRDKLVHTNGDAGLSDPAALALLAERLAKM